MPVKWTYIKVYLPQEMKDLLREVIRKEGYLGYNDFFRSLARRKIENYLREKGEA